ncbi:MAG: hypothetical protein ACYTG5_10470 [Planctomycetota bacterium]|jgi:hypothetical protein
MRSIICLCLGTVLCTSTAYAQFKGGVFNDPELGLKLRVPKGWTQIPLKENEQWVAAKFLSDKSYLSKDKDWNREHKPFMQMIVFSDKAKKQKLADVEENEEGVRIRWRGVPYQGYQDYLKRNMSGFFISKEEQTEIAGIKCTVFEVNLHNSTPKFRLMTWVFHGESVDVAVEFESLEDRVDKLATIARRSAGSFRFVEPTSETISNASSDNEGGAILWATNFTAWNKKSAKEREQIRKAHEDRRFDKVTENTPKTWDVNRSKSFLVVSHADKRFTQRNTQAAEAFRTWCDKHLGKLSDDYVRHQVLRICKDGDEYLAYQWRDSGATYSYSLLSEDYEIVTFWDSFNGTSGGDVGFMFSTILDGYIQDKDRRVYVYTPLWVKVGLNRYVSSGKLKGKKLEFPQSDGERQGLRTAIQNDKMRSFRDLISMPESSLLQIAQSDRTIVSQVSAALRFVIEEGRRHKPLKDFLLEYMSEVSTIVGEKSKDWSQELLAANKEAQTEEEEEAQRKNRGQTGAKQRAELQAALTERMCNFSDKEWSRMNKAFAKFVN